MATHTVFNQVPPLVGHNVFADDALLTTSTVQQGAEWAMSDLTALGALAGTAEAIRWGFEANENPPTLHTHDATGQRLDTVTYHPSYHRLMDVAVSNGLHASPHSDPRPGAHVARAAGFFVWSQVEAGHGCPISMTYSVVPALRAQPELAAEWEPRLTSTRYDESFRPAAEKFGLLAGMGMTEKQGGSDVRANTTRAQATTDDGAYLLTGHKWFCSAPMSDVFLMLAQAPGGLSCFLVPRFLPDGSQNEIRLQRLKDKLGNRSNASSEIELDGTWGQLVGEQGRGVSTIITMVQHTRLDCVIGAAATMRQAVTQAIHHATYREAFGRPLVDQPLMTNVLADIALEAEAAMLVMLRLARAYDEGDIPESAAFRRVAVAVSKYWVCKRCPLVAAEALECLGGNGFIEESIMPRLFRESPLNGIWEGSGNVICLDVLRALLREPDTWTAFRDELEFARGSNDHYDNHVSALDAMHGSDSVNEASARQLVGAMAVALQASLMIRYARSDVAEAFCATRLASPSSTFGAVPIPNSGAIVRRASVPHET